MVDGLANSSAVFKLTFAAGSEHDGTTNPFVPSNVTNYPGTSSMTLAHIIISYWVGFVVNHDPSPSRVTGAPDWPSYISNAATITADGQSVGFTVQAVTNNSISPEYDPDTCPRCDFFGSRGRQLRN
jgi:hypothetical protein